VGVERVVEAAALGLRERALQHDEPGVRAAAEPMNILVCNYHQTRAATHVFSIIENHLSLLKKGEYRSG
jgi:hypothetical protein